MRPPRISTINGMYHVTIRCNNKEFFIQDEEDFLLYKDVLANSKEKYNTLIHAYCITNNHVHLIVATPFEDNLSKFMQSLNGNYAKKYNKRHGKTGRFWGGRFHSVLIESETYFYNIMLYIEFNMLRCKQINDPSLWNWSSYNAHAYGKEDHILDFHPLYNELGSTPEKRQSYYRKMAQDRLREKGLEKDETLSDGIIVGSKDFVQSMIDSFGSKLPFYKNRKIYDYGGIYSIKRPKLIKINSS